MSLDRLMATIRSLTLIALCVFNTSLQSPYHRMVVCCLFMYIYSIDLSQISHKLDLT